MSNSIWYTLLGFNYGNRGRLANYGDERRGYLPDERNAGFDFGFGFRIVKRKD